MMKEVGKGRPSATWNLINYGTLTSSRPFLASVLELLAIRAKFCRILNSIFVCKTIF